MDAVGGADPFVIVTSPLLLGPDATFRSPVINNSLNPVGLHLPICPAYYHLPVVSFISTYISAPPHFISHALRPLARCCLSLMRLCAFFPSLLEKNIVHEYK